MAGNIVTRIAMDGGDEIRKELEALGRVGEIAFKRLQKAAKDLQPPDTFFVARLKEIQKELEATGKKLADVGKKVRDFGKGMSIGVTAPVAAGGAGVLKVAADFESAMIDMKVATGATAEELEKLEAKAREIGKSTSFGPRQAAAALTELAKTGTSTADILNGAADATVKLATANGADLAPAATLVSDALKQFKLDVKDVDSVVQLVSGAVNQSKLDFADFQQGMAQVGGVAGGLGMSFSDMNVALAGISSNFASGSDAGTSFKVFLQRLKPTTDEAIGIANELGLSFFDAGGRMKSLAEIAQILKTAFGQLSDEDRNEKMSAFFGTDGIRAALGLMDQGSEGVNKLLAAILRFDSTAAAEARMKGFNGQLNQLKGAIDELDIAIGKGGFLKWATDMVKSLTDLANWLGQIHPAILGFVSVVAGIAGAVGPVLFSLGMMSLGLGALSKSLGGMAGRFAPLIAGVAGFGSRLAAVALIVAGVSAWPALIVAGAALGFAVMYRYFDDINAAVGSVWERIKTGASDAASFLAGAFTADAWAAAWEGLKGIVSLALDGISAYIGKFGGYVASAFGSVVDGVGSLWEGLVSIAQGITDRIVAAFGSMVDGIKGIFDSIVGTISSAMDGVVSRVTSAVNSIVSAVKRAIDFIRSMRAAASSSSSSSSSGDGASGFATGGHVRGPGTSTSDSIAAWLSDGEFVVQAKAVRKYGLGLLHALNSMRFDPKKFGFATGGHVNTTRLKQGLPAFASGGLASLASSLTEGMKMPRMSLPGIAATAGNGIATALTPINLSIFGEQMGQVLAPEPVAANLQRYAQGQQLRSAGRKPSWY